MMRRLPLVVNEQIVRLREMKQTPEIKAALERAELALAEGDIPRLLNAYEDMRKLIESNGR